ncbi:MAG: hypothetical protein ACYS18_01275 [Planctomycetota bacterium]|jgi:hypothetical protein
MDPLTITILFIILVTIVGAFIRRCKRDKCLKDFSGNMVTLEKTDNKTIWGRLNVETTGLEFLYPQKHADKDGHDETSYIIYKHEYSNLAALLCYHDQLSEANRKKRQKQLKRTYHPGPIRRLKRKIVNLFKTVRDSVMEILNVAMTHARKVTPAGGVLASQDKYVSQMKQELMGSVGTSYEPLLEKHIGQKVVLELIRGDKLFEYCGVLKEYTADFVEIMDVDYSADGEQPARKADIVASRNYGLVRHVGE